MTVPNAIVKNEYTGDGDGVSTGTVLFNVTFQFWATSDLLVYLRVIATGVETLQVEGVDYSVTGGAGSSGQVDFTLDDFPPPTTVEVHIRRDTPTTQNVDITPLTKFPAAAVEESLDRRAMNVQEEEADRNERFLKIPVTDIPVAPATAPDMELPNTVDRSVTGALLGFDSDGNPIITVAGVSTALTTPWSETLLDDTTAAAGRATLGVPENFDDGGGANMDRIAADTIAARSAAATFGNGFYVAHDEGRAYYSTGSAWLEIGARQIANASLPAASIAGLLVLDTDNLVLKRDDTSNLVDLKAPLPRGALGGLGMTLSGTTDVSIAVGECRTGTSADRSIMNAYLTTAIVKELDAVGWEEGTTNGGRPSADGLLADKWHHVFIISKPDGTVDAGFDDDINAVNLLADAAVVTAGYTRFRYIGSVKETAAGTGIIQDWIQHGDIFMWDTLPALDFDTTTGDHTTPTNIALAHVPVDVRVEAILAISAPNNANALFAAGGVTSGATPAATVIDIRMIATGLSEQGLFRILTDTSAQIVSHNQAASGDYHIQTHGYVNARGRWD